ncbi:hypothetical protein [Saccharibacillus alkalitolerans]|uniref:6-phospho-beta-glucosidase n=1 Tax=Saccharibacillus alkalitolerans TaxID=2705290 RepID=A0ABX0F5M9_9BACL|nr:hypothetical protein [Saccharibacillus alkalitolerans]NGZ75770.1 hypothetical protein [Saccharibacillus alkalitolerans]
MRTIRGDRERAGSRRGFIHVDKDNEGRGTLNRSRKDSFHWYKQGIASNGEKLDAGVESAK